MSEIALTDTYTMNKMLIEQNGKALKGKALSNTIANTILPYFKDKFQVADYFMLLCHEDRNYTILHKSNTCTLQGISDILVDCLKNRGAIYSIERTEDEVALEIWIKNFEDIYCYYLFPYDAGVVECEE